MNKITFSIDGPGNIVATDMLSFSSHERTAFNGLALVIVKSIPGKPETITVYANSEDLDGVEVMIESR